MMTFVIPRLTPHAPRPLPLRKGCFITLEGPEGSGKSSQSRWVVRLLTRAGLSVVHLSDPGSTTLGRRLRRVLLHAPVHPVPLTEALLFIGGRVQLVEERIRPALAKGQVVVCDRFHDATVAYQGFGGGLDVAWLDRLGRSAIHGVMPALTILLDIPTASGFARLRRARDRMERKTLRFHRRVRQGYLTMARREPKRFVVIDTTQSLAQVRRAIVHVVMGSLARHSLLR